MTLDLRALALRLFPGDRDLRRSLRVVRHGYRHRPREVKVVDVERLRVRKEPTLVAVSGAPAESRYRSPAAVLENPVDRFFPLVDGHEDRRLIHLPHLELLRYHDRHGRLPEDSAYARLLRVRARLQGRAISEEEIRQRMERMVAVCRSIRERGYLGPGHRRQRIVVMERSIHPPTATYRPEGYEVFDGHHRAVAVTHLGLERVEVLITEAIQVHPFDWSARPLDPSLWDEAGPPATVTPGGSPGLPP